MFKGIVFLLAFYLWEGCPWMSPFHYCSLDSIESISDEFCPIFIVVEITCQQGIIKSERHQFFITI